MIFKEVDDHEVIVSVRGDVFEMQWGSLGYREA